MGFATFDSPPCGDPAARAETPLLRGNGRGTMQRYRHARLGHILSGGEMPATNCAAQHLRRPREPVQSRRSRPNRTPRWAVRHLATISVAVTLDGPPVAGLMAACRSDEPMARRDHGHCPGRVDGVGRLLRCQSDDDAELHRSRDGRDDGPERHRLGRFPGALRAGRPDRDADGNRTGQGRPHRVVQRDAEGRDRVGYPSRAAADRSPCGNVTWRRSVGTRRRSPSLCGAGTDA